MALSQKGIDIRQTGTALVFRAFLQTSAGALLGTGTTVLSITELQSDGTIKSYDFNDNTFKTTALTTPTLALTHRPSNNAGTTTGLWTVALATVSGFTVGGIYHVIVNNSGASPTDQMREFQYGGAEGDLAVTAGATGVAYLQDDAIKWSGTTITATSIPVATAAGAAGGLFIAGSNAATTISGLTTGALSCTTITASGAVAFQSTFAVTTSTSLAALSATTVTFSGAVAFQSTFAITTSTSLAALSCTTLTASGAVAFQSTFATTGTTTFNAFTVTNATTLSGAVSMGSTLGVTGTVTFNAFTVTNNLLVSGTTTFTGNVAMSGTFNIVGAATFDGITAGTVNDGAPTSSSFVTAGLGDGSTLGSGHDFEGWLLVFTSGTNAGQAREILSFAAISRTVTLLDAFTRTPANSDAFVVVPGEPKYTNWANTLDSSYRVDVGKINSVAATSVTTINANVGTTQPTNFTGSGASAYVKVDAIDWNSVGVTGMPMPTYTQPSGFLAATFPSGTIANTTNITAGTITTVGTVTGGATAANQTTIISAIATVQADTDDIQTRLPAALVGGKMDSTAVVTGTVTLADGSLTTAKLGAFVLAKTTNITGFNDIAAGTAMTLTSGERNDVATALLDLTDGVETGLTLRQAQRVTAASAAGVLSGATTTTITIKGAGVTTTRLVGTVDADGNRTAITLTP